MRLLVAIRVKAVCEFREKDGNEARSKAAVSSCDSSGDSPGASSSVSSSASGGTVVRAALRRFLLGKYGGPATVITTLRMSLDARPAPNLTRDETEEVVSPSTGPTDGPLRNLMKREAADASSPSPFESSFISALSLQVVPHHDPGHPLLGEV